MSGRVVMVPKAEPIPMRPRAKTWGGRGGRREGGREGERKGGEEIVSGEQGKKD